MNTLDIYAGIRARLSFVRERQGIRKLIDRLVEREVDRATRKFEAEMSNPTLAAEIGRPEQMRM